MNRGIDIKPHDEQRKRVLFLNSSVSGGGAGKSLVPLVTCLDNDYIDPVVVLPFDGTIGKVLRNRGIRVIYMPLLPERYGKTYLGIPKWMRREGIERIINIALFPYFILQIGRIIKRCKIDVLYSNHIILNSIVTAAGRLFKKPVYLHMRDFPSTGVARDYFIWQSKAPCVKQVICVSKAVEELYKSSHKTKVIYDTLDVKYWQRSNVKPALRERFNIDDNTKVVGFMGRMVEWKGLDLLLEGFKLVADAHSDVVLAIVGGNDPSLRVDMIGNLRKRAEELGIADKVKFCGFQEDPRPYVVDFDVAVLASTDPEPFGRVIVEAMSLGVAVVVSAHGGARELVQDGVNGLLFEPRSAESLAQAITTLVADDALRARLIKESAHTVRDGHEAEHGGKAFTHAILEGLGIPYSFRPRQRPILRAVQGGSTERRPRPSSSQIQAV